MSEFHQEHSYENTKVKQDKMDALKLRKFTFHLKKVPKKHFFQAQVQVQSKVKIR